MTDDQNLPAAQRHPTVSAAFVSADDAVDRAAVIACLACLVAGNGHSVLVLDLPEAVDQVADYLRPFATGGGPARELAGAGLDREFTAVFGLPAARATILTRHALHPAAGRIDVLTLPALERPSQTWRAAAQQGDPTRLRQEFTHSAYEYILINAPSLREQSDDNTRAIFTSVATVCDVAVVCCSHRDASVHDAERIGRSLRRRAPGGIQVVPLSVGAGKGHSDLDLDAIFADLLDGNRHPGAVLTLPEFSAPTPVIPVLLDQPDAIAAHTALASTVTGGAVAGPGPVPRSVFDRYRRATGFAAGVPQPRFLVASAPGDPLWTDWLTAQLRAGGAEVGAVGDRATWLDESEPVELIVIGGGRPGVAEAGEQARGLAARASAFTEVVVDGTAASLPDAVPLHLGALSAEKAEARLRSYFGLTPPSGNAVLARYPAEDPGLANLPPAPPPHTGRERELGHLRELLVTGGGPVRIGGEPGAGKTALAREYAHRFANGYDVIWWISAHDRESTLSGLVTLSRALRADARLNVPGPLALPGSALPTSRWLLVFDDGDTPEVYEDVLPPPGRCHVLVTSTAPGDVNVGPLGAGEAAALLQQQLSPLPTDTGELTELAAALGCSPLAIELSAAWLTEVLTSSEINPEQTSTETRKVIDDHIDRLGVRAAKTPVAAVLDIMTTELSTSSLGRMTLLLAQFCSFLSPEGVSLALLRSKEIRRQLVEAGSLDAGQLAVDAAETDVLLAYGARLGLFRVGWGKTRTLVLDRVVRQVLRESLPDEVATRLRNHVLSALAAYAPAEQESDQPTAKARFAELNHHVMSAGAPASNDQAVRQWLVDQTRYLYDTGEPDVWEVAVKPALEVYEQWTETQPAADTHVCMLASQVANLCRGLGRYQQALELDTHAMETQRLYRGRAHYRSLLAARGVSADLRALGRLEDAVDEDIATLHGLRNAFGEDHPQTLAAESNLATARFHAGDIAAAARDGLTHCARRDRLFGRDDPRNWHALANLGVYQRAMGQFALSIATLSRAHDLVAEVRPEPPHGGPMVNWQWSISQRLGPDRDIASAKGRNGEALTTLRDLLGERHLLVVACKLSFANAQREAAEAAHAVTAITECIEVLSEVPGHQHDVAICRVMLALALTADDRPGEAAEPAEDGLAALRDHIGPAHPLTLAAGVDLAAVLAAAGRPAAARKAAHEAVEACEAYLPGRHYYRGIAAANHRKLDAGREGTAALRYLDLDISMP